MACFSFLPKIDVCIADKCNTICIKEVTDIIQSPYNTTGWGDANITTDEVTTAIVTILNRTGTSTILSFTIKDTLVDLYPNTAPTPFVLTTDEAWSSSDGIFKVVYTVTDEDDNVYYNTTQYVLFICNIQNCFKNLVLSILKECDVLKIEELKTLLNQLEVIIYGIKCAFSSAEYATAETLIASAKTICDNICDCGCGDC